jgi:hypothetical protein
MRAFVFLALARFCDWIVFGSGCRNDEGHPKVA